MEGDKNKKMRNKRATEKVEWKKKAATNKKMKLPQKMGDTMQKVSPKRANSIFDVNCVPLAPQIDITI